jgi:hypothetical protein
MRRSYSVILATVVAAMTTACAQRMSQESGGDVVLDASASTGSTWASEIKGSNGWENLRASAFAQVVDQGTRVSLTIDRALPGSNYAWDVREGACATPGRTLGDSTTYVQVFVGENGRDGRVVELNEKLDRTKPYVVRIYSPAVERTNTVACGRLKPY